MTPVLRISLPWAFLVTLSMPAPLQSQCLQTFPIPRGEPTSLAVDGDQVWYTAVAVSVSPTPTVTSYIGKLTKSSKATDAAVTTGSWLEGSAASMGTLWATDSDLGYVFQYSPAGSLTATPSGSDFTNDIIADPDGTKWFITRQSIVRIDQDEVWTTIPKPFDSYDMVNDQRGSLWLAAEDRLVRYDTHTFQSHHYVAPSGTFVYRLAVAPDGAVWFTDRKLGKDRVGRFDPIAETYSSLLLKNLVPGDGMLLHSLAFSTDGSLWVTFDVGHACAVALVSATGEVRATYLPREFAPHGVVAGAHGEMWFMLGRSNLIGRIQPKCRRRSVRH